MATAQGGRRLDIAIDCSLTRQPDPVGATLTCRVPDAPNPQARAALLDELDAALVGQRGNLVFQSVRVAHGALRSYGERNDYDVEPVTETVRVEHERTTDHVTVRWWWDHDAAQYFNFGVSPHTIDGNPILSFIWEDAPQGVRELFPYTERVGGDPRVFFRSVEHPGIPASHYVRAGARWLQRELTN